ncbi:uncharacterized protein LOC131860094 [Cryptomeria japonica]|uniref:uncharacterized protein LOC131860094 n=1 Tax=Cryptomeria japonica TaxID=3369 RepID=UPI0027DA3AD9|nr:uncharacterized protein LOC131860094 [Cryptomeria japonica]
MFKAFYEKYGTSHGLADATSHQILKAGYYWPSIFKDAHEHEVNVVVDRENTKDKEKGVTTDSLAAEVELNIEPPSQGEQLVEVTTGKLVDKTYKPSEEPAKESSKEVNVVVDRETTEDKEKGVTTESPTTEVELNIEPPSHGEQPAEVTTKKSVDTIDKPSEEPAKESSKVPTTTTSEKLAKLKEVEHEQVEA